MHFEKIHAVYFSPTGNVQKLVRRLAERLSSGLSLPVREDDFTLPAAREERREYGEGELVLFGLPTYAGRIPNKILPAVQTLFKGQGTPAIALVCFGNRAYDNSLKELRNELSGNGFLPFAAAAIPTSHVFSEKIAPDRPDSADLAAMDAWIEGILRLLAEAKGGEYPGKHGAPPLLSEVSLGDENPVGPYYTPLGRDGKPAKFLKAVPHTDPALCVRCGKCASSCPMGSISASDPAAVAGVCIKCHACVRKCPRHAKSFADPALLSHITMLEENYTRRADLAFFCCEAPAGATLGGL